MFAVKLFSKLLIGKAHVERNIKPQTKAHFDIKSYFPGATFRKDFCFPRGDRLDYVCPRANNKKQSKCQTTLAQLIAKFKFLFEFKEI